MTRGAPAPEFDLDPLADALLAVRLLAIAPQKLGGICLRGGGPARALVLGYLKAALPETSPWRRLPANIDDEGLLGGVDIAASLAEGRAVERAGLLSEARGGVLVVPMAERLRETTTGRLAQTLDDKDIALVALDDGREADEGPADALLDRVAFKCDLSRAALLDHDEIAPKPLSISHVTELEDEQLAALAAVSAALGIGSVRPLLFALTAARAHAALHRRKKVRHEDLSAAVSLVLAPRATQLPQEQLQESEPAPPPDRADDPGSNDREQSSELPPEEMLIEAALASIPPDVLTKIAAGKLRRSAGGGASGKRIMSKLRGKPLGARPGIPCGGARLALIDSLRAAAPWQRLRRPERGDDSPTALFVEKDDLRIRRFEERAGSVTIFCVDASGSAAVARLAEAKGAVERILAQAYVKRSEVALIAFRGAGAEMLLPPTRSLTRARRALSELPGGGGTPLASGLQLGLHMAEAISSRGRTPFLVSLTDGSANIAADGTPGRAQAKEDAHAAARAMALRGIDSIVIDISPRPRVEAAELAQVMEARYLPLPMADAAALERAVNAAQPGPQLVR
ncbi:MAG: magnesium chelatase subunit D [Proteobacteria bacterium]|nr:magnesium chelatase subunit D [Pseudomonadota bacterium]MDA0914921.1 magnesium chelatase subunit D [Pseudomonadota bacterium]MDA1032198.1 magnesium chelatase subunit D [Pseudomonadota bacterium]